MEQHRARWSQILLYLLRCVPWASRDGKSMRFHKPPWSRGLWIADTSLCLSCFCLLVDLEEEASIINPREEADGDAHPLGLVSRVFSGLFSLPLLQPVSNDATAQFLEGETFGEVIMCQVWSPIRREASWKSIRRHRWVRSSYHLQLAIHC